MAMVLLIVDDEKMNVICMMKGIIWHDYGVGQVKAAYNSYEARRILSKGGIDLILCDIEMPGESGIDLMHWVRECGMDIPCIFLTCHAKFEYAQEAIRLRCQDYLLMPAPYEEIAMKVKKNIELLQEERERFKDKNLINPWIEGKKQEILSEQGKHISMEQLTTEIEYFVMEHLNDCELSIKMIAKQFYLNEDYIRRVFRNERGVALGRYIIKQRMSLAAQLLMDKKLNIRLIAEKVGYQDDSYFVKAFKKEYGCVPSKYKSES